MSNFAFTSEIWPEISAECGLAESYLANDPRSTCIYARRVIEALVEHIYEVEGLPDSYVSDLSARVNHPEFKNIAGNQVVFRLNAIRKFGNTAAHGTSAISKATGLQVLRDLYSVVKWAMYNYSPHPELVPQNKEFDTQLAEEKAPLSKTEVTALLAHFDAQDEKHKKELELRDADLDVKNAELKKLREEIALARTANRGTLDPSFDEAATRTYIDAYLKESGWPLTNERDREFEVTGMPNEQGIGFVDYVLWGADGLPLAVVEAKRTSRSAQEGQHQSKLYADCLEAMFNRRPVIYYSNGYETWIWDDANGYPPREVAGYCTAEELELLIARRNTRGALSDFPIDATIVERPYQHRAIRAVGDAFERKQREALLVMATGAGKTRTVVALVEQLMKANWAKRVLFLADRLELVKQGGNAFKAFLPNETTVNLQKERNSNGRVYVATYQTMMGLINELDEKGERRFGPGYFDLVVIDEAHRSVYAKYGAIFEYFDSMLLGLTATPKDEVDHNTYRLFNLEDGVPTDAYSLDEAVADGYLVPPKAVAVGTTFLRQGIKYDDLTEEEQDQWDSLEWGEDGVPSEVGAAEINQFLFNEDTVDKVLGTLMSEGYKVASGDRIGKTIIFAKSQQHAEFIEKRFNIGWPEFGGELARVITYQASYVTDLIDKFKQPEQAPHIAISVDMLDTGIDVPEVVNLVFFKPVRSKSKFWQMIGRGTRLRKDIFGPGQDKKDFFVFDFCGNLEYFSQDFPGSPGSIQKPLSQRIFEARVALTAALDVLNTQGDPSIKDLREATADALRQFIQGINLDNVLVRPHLRAIDGLKKPEAWVALGEIQVGQLVEVSGLPSSAQENDEDAKRFDMLILTRQLAQLNGDEGTGDKTRLTIQRIAQNLLTKLNIPAVAERAELLEALAGEEWWIDVSLPMLEHARKRIRGLLRFADKNTRVPVYTDFEDAFTGSQIIHLPGVTPGTNFDRFKQKAEAYLRAHEGNLSLQKLRRGKTLTQSDLDELGRMLEESGAAQSEIELAESSAGSLGRFIRSLVGLERSAVEEAFAGLLNRQTFGVNQIRFIELVVDELTRNGSMDPGRLYESPFTDYSPAGPDQIFEDSDLRLIVDLVTTVNESADSAAA
jgi:type I restriction enzyme R subunit